MRTNFLLRRAALASALFAATAQAGGPLILSESTNRPVHWDPSKPIAVYVDQGDLCDTVPDPWSETGEPRWGCLTAEQARAAVAFGFDQWSKVETSTLRAKIQGDFSALGLGDITGANAGEIIGKWNGGGYHVLFDADSTILQDFFGAPPGVLGISSPEWFDGEVITEAWAVIGVASVPKGDDGRAAAGVMTHEFGHGIGLSHSQTNGHITFIGAPWNWISWAPKHCKAPYDVSVVGDGDTQEGWAKYNAWIDTTMIPAIETMYPYISPRYTAEAQSTVGRDDRVAVSNLYPAANWRTQFGSISGRILLKDGTTQLTGVNVVARNVKDPINDAVTVMSGDQTQGKLGPDGRFTINGLTPGAKYVLYVENILAGGFPTPVATLPSFQEYWNGASESTDASRDDPCAWSEIPAVAGRTAQADIAFNGIDRAPKFVSIPVPSATDVDSSGKTIVGTYFGEIAWRYNTLNGEWTVVNSRQSPALARDGKTMTIATWPDRAPWDGGIYAPGLWSPNKGYQMFSLPPGETGCDGMIFLPADLSENGSKVVGLGFRNQGGENGCSYTHWNDEYTQIVDVKKYFGTVWTADKGIQSLETPDMVLPNVDNCQFEGVKGCRVLGSRANAISGDGRTVVGHVDVMAWIGAAWVDGKLHVIGSDDPKGFVGEANAVNRDGSVIVGGGAGPLVNGYWLDAYLWNPTRGLQNIGHLSYPCESIAPWLCYDEFGNSQSKMLELPSNAFVVSDAGDIVLGRAGDFGTGYVGFIWIKGIGMFDFNTFLQRQGVMEAYTTALVGPTAVSGDGKTIVGWGLGEKDMISFALTLDQVWVCEKGKSSLAGFPGGAQARIAGGASLGLCAQDRPIEPWR